MEQCVRDRVYKDCRKQINIRRACMTDVVINDGKIEGAMLSTGEVLDCDILVDAMGRASRMPHILSSKGMATPRKVSVDPKVSSASRIVKMPRDWSEVRIAFGICKQLICFLWRKPILPLPLIFFLSLNRIGNCLSSKTSHTELKEEAFFQWKITNGR